MKLSKFATPALVLLQLSLGFPIIVQSANAGPIEVKNKIIKVTADQSKYITPEQIVELTNKVSPIKPLKKAFINISGTKIFISDQGDLKIKTEGKKVRFQNKTGINYTITMPLTKDHIDSKEVNGAIVYSGTKANYDIVSQPIDGGSQLVINLKDESAPQSYDFVLSEDPTDTIAILSNGGAELKDKEGKVKVSILPPWAKDANGKTLPTKYNAQKTILTQEIDTSGAVFPVVADPAWCGQSINSVNWINRDNQYSASINPTWCGRVVETDTWAAWGEFYNKTPYHWTWNWNERAYGTSKYWSMFDQFKCHFANPIAAIVKGEWNLEPHRPHVGIVETFKKQCNP